MPDFNFLGMDWNPVYLMAVVIVVVYYLFIRKKEEEPGNSPTGNPPRP
jgi:hypothetical protein